MATNKNKNSAALFELLDKSTLKVPKSGSLKIPAWWSSKTNPPAAAAPVSVAPPPQPARVPMPGTGDIEPPTDDGTDSAVPESAGQVRVISKSASAQPAASSSIRPPARLTAPAPVKRPPSTIFAPQTVDQSGPRENHSRGAPPLWLLLAGGGVALLLLVIVLLFIFGGSRGGNNRGNSGISSTANVPVVPEPETPGDSNPNPQQQKRNTENQAIDNLLQQQQEQQAWEQGHTGARVIPFDQVRRIPNAYYLFIFTADEKTALANAQYLAAHGVSTSVSSTNQAKYFVVISVDGFARLDDPQAKAFKTHIIELGRAHPDARKARTGVYDTAYFYKIIRQ